MKSFLNASPLAGLNSTQHALGSKRYPLQHPKPLCMDLSCLRSPQKPGLGCPRQRPLPGGVPCWALWVLTWLCAGCFVCWGRYLCNWAPFEGCPQASWCPGLPWPALGQLNPRDLRPWFGLPWPGTFAVALVIFPRVCMQLPSPLPPLLVV
ncbi:hypothetical protein DSO57_1021117 [Entomophthora muscae]|uniref:Uncharacterized protein n=1 Tax=Entomophthora muscae TaxID=34485 RepID=A0ACC2UP72_9FUNG|nr:hypothetical protein DSO57_1021117 [Entomophthora muscae]